MGSRGEKTALDQPSLIGLPVPLEMEVTPMNIRNNLIFRSKMVRSIRLSLITATLLAMVVLLPGAGQAVVIFRWNVRFGQNVCWRPSTRG
jgi:hypothetical protein